MKKELNETQLIRKDLPTFVHIGSYAAINFQTKGSSTTRTIHCPLLDTLLIAPSSTPHIQPSYPLHTQTRDIQPVLNCQTRDHKPMINVYKVMKPKPYLDKFSPPKTPVWIHQCPSPTWTVWTWGKRLPASPQRVIQQIKAWGRVLTSEVWTAQPGLWSPSPFLDPQGMKSQP